MKKINISERTFIIGLFLLALFIRLAYVLRLDPQQISGDCYEWMGVASDILSGKGFGDTWRPPGYPAYLAAVMFVFGKSVVALRVMNALLGSLTCVIVYFIGRKIFSAPVGRIAAALTSFYPYLIAYTGDPLSETFLTFMISVSILSILIVSEKPSARNIILTGVILGLTALTKSTILPFFGLACAWIWWQSKSFKAAFFVGILTLLTMAPWTARNYFYYGKFIPVSTAGRSWYLACNDQVHFFETAGEFDTPQTMEMARPGIPEKEYLAILELPRMEQERIFTEKGNAWVKANPDKFRFLLKARFLHFWRLYPMMAYKWQKLAAKLTSGIYIPLCLIGMIWSWREFRKTSLLILLFVIFTLAHIFFVVVMRYRVPIDPYVIIFASYTIHRAFSLAKGLLQKNTARGAAL